MLSPRLSLVVIALKTNSEQKFFTDIHLAWYLGQVKYMVIVIT